MSFAVQAQQSDDILNILVRKNVLTQQEADSIRSEQATREQKKRDKEKENQHNIFIGSRALQISGLVQARYQVFEQKNINDAFDLHRARLDAKGSITDKWSYEIYTEFAASVKLLDAYTTYKIAAFLKVTAGQFKIPFSYESLTPDSQLEFIDRSQAVEALAGRSKDIIGNQNGRDIGIQVSGDFIKVKDRYLLDYAFGVFNGAGYDVTTDNNNYKDIAVRLGVHVLKGLNFGGSFYGGEDIPAGNTQTQVRNRFGFDGRFMQGPLSLTTEYVHGTDASVQKQGWYAQAGYFVVWQKLQLVARYDTYNPNSKTVSARTRIYTTGANYVFNQWTRLEINYLNKREEKIQTPNNIIETQMQIAF
ncbi:MAG TPA: porin [Mucilaginibacter sp.]|nr:porin [Mucilaginibacter sp.]